MENKPGNGYSAPFGNEKGATSDGPSSGAHNFVEDPASHAPTSGGRDFTQENRAQEADGMAPDINKDSIPDGGILPFPAADPAEHVNHGTIAGEARHMPFKLGGG